MSQHVTRVMEGEQTQQGSKPRLLQLVRDAIVRRHFSYRTEQAYVHWIKRVIFFSGKRHHAAMGAQEVSLFLNHLARIQDLFRKALQPLKPEAPLPF